jgi:hypothetical protein
MAEDRTANPRSAIAIPLLLTEQAQNSELLACLRPRCQAMGFAQENLTWEAKAQSLSRVLAVGGVRREVKPICC